MCRRQWLSHGQRLDIFTGLVRSQCDLWLVTLSVVVVTQHEVTICRSSHV